MMPPATNPSKALLQRPSASLSSWFAAQYSVPGFLKQFTEKVRIQMKATTATDAGIGLKIDLSVYYVVD